MKHDVRIRAINPREIVTKRKDRRGRVTGVNHSLTNDGYQARCDDCDWTSRVSYNISLLTALATGHEDATAEEMSE